MEQCRAASEKYITLKNCKIVACVLVVFAIVVHLLIADQFKNDGTNCRHLLHDGALYGGETWQPTGCMLHKYKPEESQKCLNLQSFWQGNSPHIVFVGDSRVRQLFFAFVKSIGGSETPFKSHENIRYQDEGSKAVVEFFWQPFVDVNMQKHFERLARSSKAPDVVVVGSATWTMKYIGTSQEIHQSFFSNLTELSGPLNKVGKKTNVLWAVQDPVFEAKLYGNRSMITNHLVNLYNKMAENVLAGSSVHLWRSSRQIGKHFTVSSPDGLHSCDQALLWKTEVLLNLLCNKQMFLLDGTCCTAPEPVAAVQTVAAFVFFSCAILSAIIYFIRFKSNGLNHSPPEQSGPATQNGHTEASSTVVIVTQETKPVETKKNAVSSFVTGVYSIARLGIIMLYFFLCDRQDFFMKENKHYSHLHFAALFIYVFILGFIFIATSKQTVILHREQSDEWKGWMQLIILIYHITGASKVLPIYMMIRVMVTSYLFMSGYGHFCFFWAKGNFSFHRFLSVMFRMNFLVIVLCFVMNRPYQFYYFVPLVSFWYLVIYVTMAIWPVVTAAVVKVKSMGYFYICMKIATLITAIYVLNASQVLFESIFLTQPLKMLFTTSDGDIHEWHFRWQLDRFSTVYGMVFAFIIITANKKELLNDKTDSDWLFPRGISLATCVVSIAGIIGYGVFAVNCSSKPPCNHVHSYISIIPILSFVLLRNVWGYVRVRYSALFAWVGRISLELFIGQYHIWLAADTHGRLVLIPSLPILNFIVTTFIFVLIAHEINTITGTMTTILVPDDNKLLLRNTLIFGCILVPLAVHHGMLN